MTEYKLSASLDGHGDDVRSVAFPHPNFVISASRDATVRVWKLLSPSPPRYDASVSSHGSAFINAVAYMQPSSTYPEGLIISGGKETIIEVREPGKLPEDVAEATLLGHAHNVCSLDVDVEGKKIISGSWDGSARVWSVGTWECEAVLEGHEGSVWAVLAYDTNTIITACADKMIRQFSPTGKLLRTIKGNKDVVRALCKLPKGHPSRGDFASASNDGIIRLWRLDGREVAELHGHDSFIYSLACSSDGDIFSSGEDRTVRVWRNGECIQTITHPAISVWAVAVCSETGDIVSGASDRTVRIFTKNKDREAEAGVMKALEESVKASSIPQQQVGEVNKEKLPGPDFLTQKSGTKEGQVAMIREADGSVTAHQWSQGAASWVNVGTVVDAVGSSGKKKEYLGQDFDYVFDVDIEDGKPPLKLPYNLSQNPYEAATKFIEDNELPIGYLDQVANFITTNTQGATLGQQSSQPSQAPPAGSDPYGMESRYRPGETSSETSAPPAAPQTRQRVLPQAQYLSIKTANLKLIEKKTSELNQKIITDGSKDLALNPSQIQLIHTLITQLESPTPAANSDLTPSYEVLTSIITTWPPASRFPALDLLRLVAASIPTIATYTTSTGSNIIDILESSASFSDSDRPNNSMFAVRALANLFETKQGKELADENFNKVHRLVKQAVSVHGGMASNRNLTVAVATLYINYAVLFTSESHSHLPSSTDRALEILDDTISIVGNTSDSEAIYRGLVAVGTLLTLGEEVGMAAKEIYGLENALGKAEKGIKEPRIKAVVAEIRKLME